MLHWALAASVLVAFALLVMAALAARSGSDVRSSMTILPCCAGFVTLPRMANPQQRTHILFVCMGNICRSPTAEAVFGTMARQARLADRLEIDSAGIGDWHLLSPPDHRAIVHGARRGYDLKPLRARQIAPSDFGRFDWILAMDRSNLRDLEAMRPADFGGHLGLFLDRAHHLGVREVPDPYYGGAEGFERMLDLIEQGSEAFLSELAASLAR